VCSSDLPAFLVGELEHLVGDPESEICLRYGLKSLSRCLEQGLLQFNYSLVARALNPESQKVCSAAADCITAIVNYGVFDQEVFEAIKSLLPLDISFPIRRVMVKLLCTIVPKCPRELIPDILDVEVSEVLVQTLDCGEVSLIEDLFELFHAVIGESADDGFGIRFLEIFGSAGGWKTVMQFMDESDMDLNSCALKFYQHYHEPDPLADPFGPE
jgi:hypothetical protein